MNLDELREFFEDNLGTEIRVTTDKRGQLIIYTGLFESDDDELLSLSEMKEEDVDEELDDEEIDFEEIDNDEDDE
jgi:hypothetical protein